MLGIPEESALGYIDRKLLDALRDKPRKPIGHEYDQVWVGVDPLSHGVSEMGLAAIGYSEHGEIVLLGTAAVGSSRVQIIEIKSVISMFLERLRAHPGCELATMVPIVEWYRVPPVRSHPPKKSFRHRAHTPLPAQPSNNNEVYAHELVTTFDAFPPVNKPWKRSRWGKNVADGIGVYSTDPPFPTFPVFSGFVS